MSSPFSVAGPRLRENGLAVLPIRPDGKMPAKFAGGVWRLERDWQRFCTRLPSAFEMQIWERWPDANVGLALGPSSAPAGRQLVALDIDTDDVEIVEAIMSVVPQSPVRKRGKKGSTLFYIAPQSVRSRPYNDGSKIRILDLLCSGRQTVLPPSIHPDTGEPYVWLTLDTLESFEVSDLPELPADVADRLGEALKPWGYEPPQDPIAKTDPNGDGGDTVHRQLNDAALANLEAWVPALHLHGLRRSYGSFKAVADWRPSTSGRPIHERATNLTINKDGIKDMGEGKGYTPIDLVMAATGADLDMAFKWLNDRINPPAEVIALKPRAKKGAQEPTRAPQTAAEPAETAEHTEAGAAAPAATVEPQAANDDSAPDLSAGFPPELLSPPGLLGDLVAWMNAASARPSPTLNMGAALAFLGAVMGRRFESETEARTNVYIVGVAPTAFGKSYPLKAISRVITEGGFNTFRGPEDFKSDAGVRKLLEQKPAVVANIDEMGGFLKRILDRKAAAHDKRIRDMLLSLFSKANDTYLGTEGAAERAVEIHNPNLCIFGASTPEDFWSAFQSGNVSDGLLPRFLIFDAGEKRPATVEPTADPREPPKKVLDGVAAVLAARPSGGNLNTRPIVASYGAGAKEMFADLRAEMEARQERAKGVESMVLSRVAEHTIKLALIVAVGCAPSAPIITVEHIAWARGVVECSSRALLGAVEGRIADNDRQAEYLMVLGIIRDAGPGGILRSALLKSLRGVIDLRRFDDIVSQLRQAQEVADGVVTPPGGGRPGARLWIPTKEEREKEAS